MLKTRTFLQSVLRSRCYRGVVDLRSNTRPGNSKLYLLFHDFSGGRRRIYRVVSFTEPRYVPDDGECSLSETSDTPLTGVTSLRLVLLNLRRPGLEMSLQRNTRRHRRNVLVSHYTLSSQISLNRS
jgi:hypothetical protein